jgi:hypothetical protein
VSGMFGLAQAAANAVAESASKVRVENMVIS